MPDAASKKKAPRRKPAASGGRREKNKDRARARILAAALALFREKGFERATTREISRKAGIAEGTLFNYFKTKEDLALYFFQQETDRLIEWFRAEKRLQKAALPEKLFAIVHRHLERLEPYEGFIGAVVIRSLQPRSALSPLSIHSQELRLRYLRFIREVLAEAEDSGEIPRLGDLGAYAFGLFYLGMATYWLQDDSRGKQKTLALLDRALHLGAKMLQKGSWEW
jgi:AcrR family transcriptional regulator